MFAHERQQALTLPFGALLRTHGKTLSVTAAEATSCLLSACCVPVCARGLHL